MKNNHHLDLSIVQQSVKGLKKLQEDGKDLIAKTKKLKSTNIKYHLPTQREVTMKDPNMIQLITHFNQTTNTLLYYDTRPLLDGTVISAHFYNNKKKIESPKSVEYKSTEFYVGSWKCKMGHKSLETYSDDELSTTSTMGFTKSSSFSSQQATLHNAFQTITNVFGDSQQLSLATQTHVFNKSTESFMKSTLTSNSQRKLLKILML